MGSYLFTATQDWFSGHQDDWRKYISLVQAPQPRALEIGTWEGRSAIFLLQELCKDVGELVVIDHFDLLTTDAGKDRFQKVQHNLKLAGGASRIIDDFSVPALMRLLTEEMAKDGHGGAGASGFDWIYVDGSHRADDTLLDGELVWRLARRGCIIIFDDYRWPKEPVESIEHPRAGIDAFLRVHDGEYEVLSKPDEYQMVVRKTVDMRIGFLMKQYPGEEASLTNALGYGVNIALAINSEYAMPAAVAIRSAVAHTSARCTVYVYDGGLSSEDRSMLLESIPSESAATLVFLEPRSGDLFSEYGIAWAKIDLIQRLPVERALYLDADVLARKDLRPLWSTDLQEAMIGATVDLGFPLGHTPVEQHLSPLGYFNAGVLLLDLTKIRQTALEGLKLCVPEMVDSHFKDQDALNIHFAQSWKPLDLGFNTQGLGTYASMSSSPRDAAIAAHGSTKSLDDPSVVHFTGPLSPSLAKFLNPWVQPATSKPWGYAGAVGHPYTQEWWSVVKQTAWRDVRKSVGYREKLEVERQRVVREAVAEFEVQAQKVLGEQE